MKYALVVGHALADAVENCIHIGLALGVAGLGKLLGRIDGDDDDCGKNRDNAYDNKDFDKGEAAAAGVFHCEATVLQPLHAVNLKKLGGLFLGFLLCNLAASYSWSSCGRGRGCGRMRILAHKHASCGFPVIAVVAIE